MGRYLFGDRSVATEPKRINKWYSRVLTDYWHGNEEFITVSSRTEGETGTHSIRKLPATLLARMGLLIKKIECRGRWKGPHGSAVVNRYISTDQEGMDGECAAKLCIGGAIKYKLKPYCGVGRTFLLEVVVPKTHEFFRHDESSKSIRPNCV